MLHHLALMLLTVSPLALQDQEHQGPAVYALSELSIQRYDPTHVSATMMHHIAQGIVGRSFYLKERGGVRGQPIDNMVQMGDSLLLYDTADYLARMQAALEAIDVLQETERPEPDDERVTFHYTPRHMSMSDLLSIVEGMSSYMTMARERHVLVVHDRQSVVNEIKTLLAEVDVPVEQVLVTAYLVRGWNSTVEASGSKATGPGLPADLKEHLGRLVPGLEFESAGFAMLQTAVLPSRNGQVGLQLIDVGQGAEFSLSFAPTAYDSQTGSLSVEDCSLTALTQSGTQRIFSTNTVFRGGEYTVLGATGAKPMFVIVRLTKV